MRIENVAFEEAKRNDAAKETNRQGMGRSSSKKSMQSLSSCGEGEGPFSRLCGLWLHASIHQYGVVTTHTFNRVQRIISLDLSV